MRQPSPWRTGTRHRRGPSTSARGLGYAHQKERKAWVPRVRAGIVRCSVCLGLIHPKEPWHLDHLVPTSLGGDPNGAKHPAHRRCNIAKGGRNRIKRPRAA